MSSANHQGKGLGLAPTSTRQRRAVTVTPSALETARGAAGHFAPGNLETSSGY